MVRFPAARVLASWAGSRRMMQPERSTSLCTDRDASLTSAPAKRIHFPRFERPRASIVVLAWRQREHLIECLRSLRESLDASLTK